MQDTVKLCATLAVVWSVIYTASFSAAELRDGNRHGAAAAAAVTLLLAAVYFVCIPEIV